MGVDDRDGRSEIKRQIQVKSNVKQTPRLVSDRSDDSFNTEESLSPSTRVRDAKEKIRESSRRRE